ncbi:YgaP family membrane protein [Sagittula sp. SSi028]|uniref:YgaP family membrane protein n=1 Tax=Sagittula sp. SSi028 TaxID=3400636 RepID=UPI003AF65C12
MKKNVGKTDRIIRAIAGAVLLIAALTALGGGLAWVVGIIGAVLFGTAAASHCPPYTLLGINTCKTR